MALSSKSLSYRNECCNCNRWLLHSYGNCDFQIEGGFHNQKLSLQMSGGGGRTQRTACTSHYVVPFLSILSWGKWVCKTCHVTVLFLPTRTNFPDCNLSICIMWLNSFICELVLCWVLNAVHFFHAQWPILSSSAFPKHGMILHFKFIV